MGTSPQAVSPMHRLRTLGTHKADLRFGEGRKESRLVGECGAVADICTPRIRQNKGGESE